MKIKETPLWTWQIVTGLVIFVLLGLHMGIMHLNGVLGLHVFNPGGDDPLAWENVTYRARQAFFTVTYVLMLAAALFHGLNGLRTVLFETFSSPRARKLVVTAVLVVGAGLLVLGTWAAIAARSTAAL